MNSSFNLSRVMSLPNIFDGEGISTKGVFAVDNNQQLTMKEYDRLQARRADPDNVSWTYCIIFPARSTRQRSGFCGYLASKVDKTYGKTQEQLIAERENIIKRLRYAEFEVELFYTTDKQRIVCKVGATDKRLLEIAEAYEYALRVNENSLKHVLEQEEIWKGGEQRLPVYLDYPYRNDYVAMEENEELRKLLESFKAITRGGESAISQQTIYSKLHEQSKMSPFSNIHIRYKQEEEARIAEKFGVQIFKSYGDDILRMHDRIKLTKMAIQGKEIALEGAKGAGLNLERLQIAGVIQAAYPICFSEVLAKSGEITVDELYAKWTRTLSLPWSQPIDDIRDYCGEKIALYFAFLGFYTLWLVPAALVGLDFFIWQVYELYAAGGTDYIFGAAIVKTLDDDGTLDLDVNGKPQVILPTEVAGLPYYALFIALWGTFYLEFWKRYEARIALKWGMSKYERKAQVRPEFQPTFILPNPISGLPEFYRSPLIFTLKLVFSFSTVVVFVLTVVLAIFGTLVFKVVMEQEDIFGETFSAQVALALNAVLILILNKIFKITASKLNDWENHRTDIEYEDSLIIKTFLFTFCNSYTTLAYYAYWKRGTELNGVPQFCLPQLQRAYFLGIYNVTVLQEADSCYASVGYSLLILFGTQIILSNLAELGLPYLNMLVKEYSSRSAKRARQLRQAMRIGPEEANAQTSLESVVTPKLDGEEIDEDLENLMSPSEQQFYLEQYQTPFEDYLELAIYFGYVTLFVAAFPLAPCFALFAAYVELRVDSSKICFLSRRPDPNSTQDIGRWLNVFVVLSFVSVCSNAAILLFTVRSPIITDAPYDSAFRVWLFVLFIAAVYGFKFVTDYFIPDTPRAVQIQLDRQEYFERKVFLAEPDSSSSLDFDNDGTGADESGKTPILKFDPLLLWIMKDTANVIKENYSGKEDALERFSRSIFNEVDTDDKGELRLKTAKKMVYKKKYGAPLRGLSKYETSLLLDAMDINRDGYLSKEEFDRHFVKVAALYRKKEE